MRHSSDCYNKNCEAQLVNCSAAICTKNVRFENPKKCKLLAKKRNKNDFLELSNVFD